jgi:N-methylhydantoinase A
VDFEIPHQLRIMQSNGGIITLSEARKAGVQCIVSGPAGGVVGASYIGQLSIAAANKNDDFRFKESKSSLRLIAFDMGGTSTDVCLIDGQPSISTESIVSGFPIGIPMLDVHTIGAGGGSIARVDLGGALRVGPESAGAEPGPACYALGLQDVDLPTVTDANVVLGRLPVDNFLGGKMKLDAARANAVMEKLGKPLGLDANQTAQGVIEVINAHMERALRLVTIERGHDPESFSLLSFGGAGGLHAVQLAKKLSIPRVVVPPLASTLSAFGMLIADAIKDYSQTVMLPGAVNSEELDAAFQNLVEKGTRDLLAQGFASSACRYDASLDMRYRGQSFELNIPYGKDFISNFHRTYDLLYGYSHPNVDIEIVNLRLKATGLTSVPGIPSFDTGDGDIERALIGYRQVVVEKEKIEVPLFTGENLFPGDRIQGPAIIVRQDTTIYLPPTCSTRTDSYLNQLISVID